MPPITRLVIETGSCGNSSAQRPTNCNANSVKTLIFGISGAPYTDLGTSGPTRLYAVDLRHGSVLCPANRSQLRRTQFESPCERACEKRLSSNGFMQCLAIHRYFYVFSVQIIYTSHRSKLDLEYYCVVQEFSRQIARRRRYSVANLIKTAILPLLKQMRFFEFSHANLTNL